MLNDDRSSQRIFIADAKRAFGNRKPYSQQELLPLLTEARAGSIAARNKIIESNLPLIFKIASEHIYNTDQYETCDLISAGVFGLITAIRKYDPTSDTKFISYARYWILAHIRPELGARVVHFPGNVNGDDYSISELDTPIQTEEGELSKHETMEAEENSHEEFETKEYERIYTRNLLSKLAPRDSDIIKRLYGIDSLLPDSRETIGAELKLSPERIRQIHKSGIKLMKRAVSKKR